ncbi:MAG: AAA family ATPase [Thermodesulfobacteriota bacterium]
MGQVICIANQKGGVGKTTTAVNLSTALALAERSCLLIDCDPQGHASLGAGLNRRALKGTLYHALAGMSPAREAVASTALEFLKVLPGQMELLRVETEWMGRAGKEKALRSILGELKVEYDYTVIDTPPGLGLMVVNALLAADSLLIPLQCEYYALEGLRPYLYFVDLLKRSLHPDIHVEGILLNMFHSGEELSTRIAGQVRSEMEERVFDTVIPWDRHVRESAAQGKPLLLQDITLPASRRYLSLAVEIMDRHDNRKTGKGDLL